VLQNCTTFGRMNKAQFRDLLSHELLPIRSFDSQTAALQIFCLTNKISRDGNGPGQSLGSEVIKLRIHHPRKKERK